MTEELKLLYPKDGLTNEQFSHAKTLSRAKAIKYIKENATCVEGLKSAAIYYDLYINVK